MCLLHGNAPAIDQLPWCMFATGQRGYRDLNSISIRSKAFGTELLDTTPKSLLTHAINSREAAFRVWAESLE